MVKTSLKVFFFFNLFGLLYFECKLTVIFKVTWKELGLMFVQTSDYLSAEFTVLRLRLSKVSIFKPKI